MREHPLTQPNPAIRAQIELILASFRHLLGEDLVSSEPDPVLAIVRAPFVVVSHDTSPDPLFNFGNLQALALWEMSWSEFVGLPSRYSAEPAHRDERSRLLRDVSERGFSRDYQGIRTSRNGRRFRIEGATVFNLVDAAGSPRGQAATFSKWTFLDGRE